MAFGQSDDNTFFNSWALWQKMTFVLACGIVITIFLGALKLWYDRSRIRKYSKVDKGKEAATPEMLEAQPVQQVQAEEMKDDIPFGVRAIESGIEVDGVWISRSNTPVGSSRASIISENRLPRSFNNSALELPQMSYASSRGSSAAPASSFDRAVSAERLPSNDSRSGSPPQAYQNRYAQGSPIYGQPNVARNSTAQYSAERSGPPSPRNVFGDSNGSSKKSSRRTSDESDYMAVGQDVRAYENAYMRPASGASPIDPRTDLDLLQSHRMSHVAETGQLTPRVRRPGNSGEWASVADNQVATHNGVSYFMPHKTPSPPLPPIADPQEEASGHASSHAPASQAQDNYQTQTNQGVPLQESYAPNAPYYPDTYQVRGPQHQLSYDEVPYEVQTMQNHQRSDSQVLRSVNSGFQVLKPGTFAPPTPEEMEMSARNERRQSQAKKLQKKRRSSGSSRKSAFTEQV